MKKYTASSGVVALSAATRKTVIQLHAPTTNRTKVTGVEVSFDGVTASDLPVYVELRRQSDAGSGSSSVTPVPRVDGDTAAATTAIKSAVTVTDVAGDPVGDWYVTPNGGTYVRDLSEDDFVEVVATDRLGVVCTAPTNAVNVIVNLIFGE